MSMNNGTADALGTAVASALAALSQAEKEDQTKVWQVVARAIYERLKADAVVNTDLTLSGVTGAGPPGGPLPIVSPAATGTGAGTLS